MMNTLLPVFIENQHTLINILTLLPTTHLCARWRLFEPCFAELTHSHLQMHTSMMNTEGFLTHLKSTTTLTHLSSVFHKRDLQHMKIRAKKTVVLSSVRGVSDAIKRAMQSVDIRVVFKPIFTLRMHLVHVKDPTPSGKKSNVIGGREPANLVV